MSPAVADTPHMGRKKKDDAAKSSPEVYRKPYKQARIRISLANIAEERAAEMAQDFTQYVNDAVRMRLEAEGKWPPKPKE